MRLLRNLGRSGSAGLLLFFGVLAVACMTVPFSLGTSSLGLATKDRMSEASQLTAQSFANQIGALSAQVQTSAKDDRLKSSDINSNDPNDPVNVLLDTVRSSNPNIRSAALVANNGEVEALSPSEHRAINVSARTYFNRTLADPFNVYVSDPFKSVLTGSPTLITVSTGVIASNQAGETPRVIGVFVISIDVDSDLTKMVSTFQKFQGVNVTIFDSLGMPIVSSGDNHSKDAVLQREIQAASKASDTADSELHKSADGKFVFSLSKVPGTSFTVASVTTNNTAYGALLRFQKRMTYMGIFAGGAMLLGLVLLARSVKARDNALRDARISGERTRLIIETAAQAYVEVNRDATVTAWNGAAETLFGWSSDEAVGRNIHDLITPDFRREEGIAELATVFTSDALLGRTIRNERPAVRRGSQTPFPAALTAWVTEIEGDRRLSFFFEDVSERRQLEAARELVFRRQRELVEELRRADEVKTDFMSTVSHELRTPLTSIVGYVEMLQEGYGGSFTKQGSSMVDVIDRNARRLLRMIEDLLTLSRIESGAERTNASLVDLRYLANQVNAALVPQVRDRGLVMNVDIAKDLPALHGDPDQLERVLINLLTNAIKFTPTGGTVGLEARLDGDMVKVEISDTGMGISKEEQHKLFSRFFRSQEARDQQVQGTGLGLVIVKSIVERHGGTIAIDSTPGSGTTVSFRLPVGATETSESLIRS